MTSDNRNISAVNTTIITGFLGVGKTSAILQLLKSKPGSERWAVLVNEFGEIGIDGSLYEGQNSEGNDLFIREVPGGCMCCTAGLPMQIALNQLLQRAKPDRLLIEPTGLGHPQKILQTLCSEHYRGVLDLQKTLTLVDARKLADERYTSHQTFNQQIGIADIVIGNKVDLYTDGDQQQLIEYVEQHGKSDAEIHFTQNGEIPLAFLSGKSTPKTVTAHHHESSEAKPSSTEQAIPECGYVRAINQGEGYTSTGWRFSPGRIFDYEALSIALNRISAERMKAVFITNKGLFGYNLTPDALQEYVLDHCSESRIEIISDAPQEDWESDLLACVTD